MEAIQDTKAMAGSPDAGFADMLHNAACRREQRPAVLRMAFVL
jgi:hypothetical protein